jgi:4-hydroxybenzoate polyprenyltransferase
VGNTGRLVLSVALAVLAGGWIALGRLAMPPLLGWAAVAAPGFTVAGCVLRREARAGADTPGRGAADFTVFAGVLIGMVGAALVSGVAVLIGLAALAAMIGSSRVLERRGPVGNVTLAALVGLPFTYGALAAGRAAGGTVPWALAAWLQLIRGMVSDLETEFVDRTQGRRTLAVRLGGSRAALVTAVLALGFVPASLLLPVRVGYGGAYFLLALFAQLAVLVTAARLIVGRIDGVSLLLNGAMVMGAVALVAGRVT